KPTGESREERIRHDFDFHETDPKITAIGRRLTREKPACKPNGPRPISLVAGSLSQGSAFCLTTGSHTMRGPLRPLVGSLSAVVAAILLYGSNHADAQAPPGIGIMYLTRSDQAGDPIHD